MKITDIAGFMGSLPSILLGLGALAVGYFGLKRWNETCIDVPFVGKFGGSCPALTPGEGEIPPPEVIDTDVLPTPGDQSCIDKCRFFFGNPLGGAPLFSGVYDWCVKGCTPEAAPVPPPAPESPPPAPESPPPAADNPCAGLKGFVFDIGYNACMAAYALMGGTDETPPPPAPPTPAPYAGIEEPTAGPAGTVWVPTPEWPTYESFVAWKESVSTPTPIDAGVWDILGPGGVAVRTGTIEEAAESLKPFWPGEQIYIDENNMICVAGGWGETCTGRGSWNIGIPGGLNL